MIHLSRVAHAGARAATLTAVVFSSVVTTASAVLTPGAPSSDTASAVDVAPPFAPLDVFELELASDPRISPDGRRVVFTRQSMDVMTDRSRSDLWIVDVDGSNLRPLAQGDRGGSNARWSPDGTRVAYVSSESGSPQIWVRWVATQDVARITHVTEAPGNLAWSPDGTRIAFTMRVPAERPAFAKMPAKPEGAEWAAPPRVIESVVYRRDGGGYVRSGFTHVFVVPAAGGTPRQITTGDFHHRGTPSWTPDGNALVLSANRSPEHERETGVSDLHLVRLDTRTLTTLTQHTGPVDGPVVSPDGRLVAYAGYEDARLGFQARDIIVVNIDGSNPRTLTSELDRDVRGIAWSRNGRGLYFRYDDQGRSFVAFASLDAEIETIASDVGGTTLGRPYSSGSFTVANDGRVAFTQCTEHRPADVAVARHGAPGVERITALNDDLVEHRSMATIKEIRVPSSYDEREIQGWLALPPGHDSSAGPYPLILEIHGGPFANYGPRFSAEVQLYAAAGYAVLYMNPRGSTSYGSEFANLIDRNYPSQDYDDLMSGVDALIERGIADPDALFVTGGSGGGVLTAWIVGKTDRFRAAVSAKPVINWASFALMTDMYFYVQDYWFDELPWENPLAYAERSPLSLVGNVTTPTMLLTGEEDYRTPMAESEQYYQALVLRGIDTALVRIPDASHGITARPSRLIAKTAYILAWFERYREPKDESAAADAASSAERD